MLHIYTGDGKGKSTAAAGLIIRAAGAGLKCAYYSFLKTGASSELHILRKIDNIKIYEFPEKVSFLWDMSEKEKQDLSKYYCSVLDEISKGDFDLLVLDEAMDAICGGIVSEDCVAKLCEKCEVVVTGRGTCEKLFKIADYVTVMKKEKHPYDRGQSARKGIEY